MSRPSNWLGHSVLPGAQQRRAAADGTAAGCHSPALDDGSACDPPNLQPRHGHLNKWRWCAERAATPCTTRSHVSRQCRKSEDVTCTF
eukprot:scaffold201_cov405-Prasinococcus_capsulatus_cf.AAC.21